MDKYKYFRVWILFSSVVIHVHASTVKVEKVYLNWTDSNEACVLLDFLSVKPNFKTLVADMKQNDKYWIKDNVVERSVVTKGCQTKVNVLNSTTIEDNILSKCFQFCSESSDTVGIQENNCSCLSNLNNGFDNVCDDQCVWTNEQCKEIAAFSVYERKDYKRILSGYRFDRCIALSYSQQLYWTKTDCSKKCHYICQKNGDLLVNSQEEVTWLEAVSICARNQSVLANILPETSVKLPRNARYRLSYWVGIRQHYEAVSDDKSVCHYIERYKANDILYGAETCTKELHYICLNEDTTSTSMVKPSDSTTQHPVSVTNHQVETASKQEKGLSGIAIAYIITVPLLIGVSIAVTFVCYKCGVKKGKALERKRQYSKDKSVEQQAARAQSGPSAAQLSTDAAYDEINDHRQRSQASQRKKDGGYMAPVSQNLNRPLPPGQGKRTKDSSPSPPGNDGYISPLQTDSKAMYDSIKGGISQEHQYIELRRGT